MSSLFLLFLVDSVCWIYDSILISGLIKANKRNRRETLTFQTSHRFRAIVFVLLFFVITFE